MKVSTQPWDDASLLTACESRNHTIVGGTVATIVGFIGLGWAALYVLHWHEVQRWEESQARIDDLDIESIHHHHDNTTHKVIASYTYKFGGRHYTGERVGLSSLADNIGGWQIGTFERLRDAKRNGRHVVCYVDARDAENAVLSREFRIGVFSIPFIGGIGFAIVGIMCFAKAGVPFGRRHALM